MLIALGIVVIVLGVWGISFTRDHLEQEGIADWEEVARKAGATKIDSVSQTFSRFNAGGRLIAAPFYMLDELSRDEIELFIFQQRK